MTDYVSVLPVLNLHPFMNHDLRTRTTLKHFLFQGSDAEKSDDNLVVDEVGLC